MIAETAGFTGIGAAKPRSSGRIPFMTPANRLRESLAAVVLVGIRLHFHPDLLDWAVVLGVCWALLPLAADARFKTAVLTAGAGALSALYLKPQIIHMLATANVLP